MPASKDILFGTVFEVIDGDTFKVDRIGRPQHNGYNYKDIECIRIASIDAPELPTRAGQRAKAHLERTLHGRRVRLEINARDIYGRLIAHVSLNA